MLRRLSRNHIIDIDALTPEMMRIGAETLWRFDKDTDSIDDALKEMLEAMAAVAPIRSEEVAG